nr:hypothetical protein [Tanacetum cinerariifolium]
MDSLNTLVVSAANLPILNPNEFDLWKMRIEQYFLMIDYSLWEVILNGDSPIPTIVVDGVVQPVSHKSADQKLARRNELKPVKLVSQVEIHGVSFSQEYVNLKFFRSLSSEWKTHTLIWRNKADLEEHSLDDLFNSLKIYKAEVKPSFSPGNPTQNLAFVSSSNTDSTTDSVSATTSVSATDVDDLEEMDLRWQMAMLTMRARRFLQKTGRNLGDNRVTSMGFYMLKVKCYNCHKRDILLGSVGLLKTQEASQTNEKHGLGYFSSQSVCESLFLSFPSDRLQPSGGYHVVPPLITGTFMPPKLDLVFHTAPIDVETDHSAFTVKLSPSKPTQDLSHTNRPSAPIIEDWPVKEPILDATLKPTNPKSNSSSKRRNRKTCFVCRSVDHLIKDCNYHAMKKAQPTPRNFVYRGTNKQNASFTHKHPQMHMVPAIVLTQSKPVSITAVRPVCAVVPKIMVTRTRHAHSIDTKSKSPIMRHIIDSSSPKTSNSPSRVIVAKAPMVSAAKGKKGKWVWRPKCPTLDHDFRTTSASMILKRFEYNDALGRSNGCSRHMKGNMSYLSYFEELNGGYVAFGGNPKGGKIFGKGNIKIGAA